MNATRNPSAKLKEKCSHRTTSWIHAREGQDWTRITTTRARSKKTRATAESASDGDCFTATTANKSIYSVGFSKAYWEQRITLFPSCLEKRSAWGGGWFPCMSMLSQCLFISTKTQVFVKINVLLLTCLLWIQKKKIHSLLLLQVWLLHWSCTTRTIQILNKFVFN